MSSFMPDSLETPPASGAKPRGRWLRRIGFGMAVVTVLAALVALAWPRPSADAVWEEAKTAFEARDFPRADAKLKLLATLRAPTTLDWMLRGQVAIAYNQTTEALEDLKHVPDDHPMAPAARLEMGQMELRQHRFVPAEVNFLKALELDPNRIQARRELIYIYGMQLRRPELNACFRELSQQSSLTFAEVFLWCLSRGVTWEPEEIVKTLAEAIKADPTDRWARLGQASSYIDMNRFDDAEASLAPLPDSDPDARAIRVRIALARGDDLRAETLLEDDPDEHAGLALLRGQMALARGDAPATLHHFRIAYTKAPHLRESVFGLGKALQLNADPTAATYLDQATKLDQLSSVVQKAAVVANRSNPQLVRDLGAACAAVGRLPEARAWYDLAITRDPLDTQANAALARLGHPEPNETAPRSNVR